MGSEGSVYQRKDGRWVAQYRDAKDKVRYIYRKTKQDAKKALREALADRDAGFVPPEKLSVGTYLDEWMEERKATISFRTWRVQNSLVNNRIKVNIGQTKLCKLTSKDVRGLYAALLVEGLSPATVRNVHVILKQALRSAAREKRIKTNPIDDVKPPKQDQKEKEVLTPDELGRLLATVEGDRFEAVFYLCSLVGLRIGEALALQAQDVDLEAGTVSINHTLYNGECSAPKTTSSHATLTVPQTCLDLLVRLCEVNGDHNTGYLFATSSGKPVDVSNFYKWTWKPALRQAGLPENITPHLLSSTLAITLHSKPHRLASL